MITAVKMNFLIAVVGFGCVLGVVFGESCTTDSDCTATQCGGGSNLICQHPDGQGVTDNGGLCTCSDTASGACVYAQDCYGDKAPNLNCPDNARHCYDGNCICSRFPIGGRREIPV